MSEIKDSDLEQAAKYQQCKPNQFGSLHERMKFVISKIEGLSQRERENFDNDLWHAIYDLETEIKYHKPASPPYGRRASQLGRLKK